MATASTSGDFVPAAGQESPQNNEVAKVRQKALGRGETNAYNEAMSFSTRSSLDLNGSLQSTVRCAWSLSFRCTQSTV